MSKWALNYGIKLSYQNVLYSMPFETDQIILDNVHNLYYSRFLLANEGFRHSLRDLCVVSTSPYYTQLINSGRLSEWDATPMQEFMVTDLIKPEYKYDVFLMGTDKFNPLWQLFKESERFYINSNYRYEVRQSDNELCVAEFSNKVLVNTYNLSLNEIKVIKACEKEVKSIENINETLSDCTHKELMSVIENLKEKGLIYASKNLAQIVSLIILPNQVSTTQ